MRGLLPAQVFENLGITKTSCGTAIYPRVAQPGVPSARFAPWGGGVPGCALCAARKSGNQEAAEAFKFAYGSQILALGYYFQHYSPWSAYR